MRAYIRLDTRFPEHKESYPDGPLSTLLLTFCYAEQQPDRGHFRPHILRALLGRRARWIPYLIEHRDLIEEDGGTFYVHGWAEWQEGDWKVAERVARTRARRKALGNGPGNGPGNGDGNGPSNALGNGARNGDLAHTARSAECRVQSAESISKVQSAESDPPLPPALTAGHEARLKNLSSGSGPLAETARRIVSRTRPEPGGKP